MKSRRYILYQSLKSKRLLHLSVLLFLITFFCGREGKIYKRFYLQSCLQLRAILWDIRKCNTKCHLTFVTFGQFIGKNPLLQICDCPFAVLANYYLIIDNNQQNKNHETLAKNLLTIFS